MNPMEAIGLAVSFAMGMVLGLAGAGGSILTVPILVYLFGLAPSRATGASLAIVGGVAWAGAILAARKGEFEPKAALLFGLPSVLVAFAIRRWLMPALPETFGGVSKDSALLILFALTMLIAARAMLKKRAEREDRENNATRWLLGGLGAGLVTGVLGAGGGFVIVPALNVGMGLPMRKAIGTSLAVIGMNAGVGLTAEWLSKVDIAWATVGVVGGVALAGMVVGMALQARIPAARLKTGFGYLIILVAIFILGKEFFGGR